MTINNYLIELGGAKEKFFIRNTYIKNENYDNEINDFVKSFHNTDVYYGVYKYENRDTENCKIYGDLYIDLDSNIIDNNSFQKVKQQTIRSIQYFEKYFDIPLEMQKIYFSGAKGFHIIIPAEILNITPDKELNIKFKKIAKLVSKNMNCDLIDLKIYDRKRLFRIPNTINSKTGLYKVAVPIDLLWTCDIDSIKEWAQEAREIDFKKPKLINKSANYFNYLFKVINIKKPITSNKKSNSEIAISKTLKQILPCAQYILSKGVQKGQRNNTTVALASSLIQSGRSLKNTIEIIKEWNAYNDPPLGEKELNTTIISAYNMVKSGKAYGCSFFKEINACVGNQCKLYSK